MDSKNLILETWAVPTSDTEQKSKVKVKNDNYTSINDSKKTLNKKSVSVFITTIKK